MLWHIPNTNGLLVCVISVHRPLNHDVWNFLFCISYYALEAYLCAFKEIPKLKISFYYKTIIQDVWIFQNNPNPFWDCGLKLFLVLKISPWVKTSAAGGQIRVLPGVKIECMHTTSVFVWMHSILTPSALYFDPRQHSILTPSYT